MAEGDRRTFASYKSDVLHALGNPDAADLSITPGTIVNDALEHVATMHEWNWLSHGQKTLDVTADQPYVALPEDFGTLLGIEHTEGWARQLIPTTWQEMLTLRHQPIQSWSWSYWYVINTGQVQAGAEEQGLIAPRLELYPTPADTQADALTIVYRRFLRRLVGDTDTPQWPAYMDRPLSLLARAFASTDYDDDQQSASSAEFRAMIEDCKTKDGLSRRSFGVPRGGIYPRTTPISPFYPRSIPDPTQV
jgi:hypothetical protein